MYYISSESVAYQDYSKSVKGTLRMNIVILDTLDNGFRLECPWQCLACRLKDAKIKENQIAGLDSTEYSYKRIVRPISGVEASLIQCLGSPKHSDDEIGWYGRRCHQVGTWHFLDQDRRGISLPNMLFKGLDSDLKPKFYPVIVSETEVAVSISNAWGLSCAVVYPMLDYSTFRAILAKYNVMHPKLAQLTRTEIGFDYRRKCPEEVKSCDIRLRRNDKGYQK